MTTFEDLSKELLRQVTKEEGYEYLALLENVHDILWDEGMKWGTGARSYWIWRRADVFYASSASNLKDYRTFNEIFEIMTDDARQARTREGHETWAAGVRASWEEGLGQALPPWRPPSTYAGVRILLTGLWDAMGEEASKENSFLYRFREGYRDIYPDSSTGLVTFRVAH